MLGWEFGFGSFLPPLLLSLLVREGRLMMYRHDAGSLITLKLLIGINLRTFATERWNGIEKSEREEEDSKSGKSRGGIGISPAEAVSPTLTSSSFDLS